MNFDGRKLRDALGRFATGVCVITTVTEEQKPVGMTANSFSSLSLDPPLVLWSLQNNSDIFDVFCQPEHFAINVLTSAQLDMSNQCARKGAHELLAGQYRLGDSGSPILHDALASFECRLETTYEGGDHLLIIGRVQAMACSDEGEPLLFYAGNYRGLQPGG